MISIVDEEIMKSEDGQFTNFEFNEPRPSIV
jgi:hypothetical protein